MAYTEVCYKLLTEIFKDGAYGAIALNKALADEPEADLITKIVLGVLDKNVELEYIISQKADKNPKNAVKIILKQGIYCLKYLNSLPDYAVINNLVELSKKVGKGGVSGFLNATLKAVARGEYTLPDESCGLDYLAVKYSKPAWLFKLVIEEYGRDTAIKILSEEPFGYAHIRLNGLLYDEKRFMNIASLGKIEYFKSGAGGFYVKNDDNVKRLFKSGLITFQSESSMYAVLAAGIKNRTNVLDICSAPGGKGVFMAELNQGGTVTACDLHPHRVELIKAYAHRMKQGNLETEVFDATKFNPKFQNRFDTVLVDAPCSGFGVIRKHPDILINKTLDDVAALAATQAAILQNAAKYVKVGGALIYSTCTITKAENIDNVNKFLANNGNYSLQKMNVPFESNGTLQLLPDKGIDGFFIARMVRNE